MDGRVARIMTSVAVATVLLTDALYVVIARAQQDGPPVVYTAPFVAVYLLLLATLLALSLMRRLNPTSRTAMRAAAAGGLLVLGIVAAFSIGLPLIVAGILTAAATVHTLSPPHLTASALSGVVAAVVSVAVLAIGLEVTARLIVCPDHGVMAGGGSGFVTGPYHYECVDGRLSFHSGSCNGRATSIDSNGNVTSNC